MPSFSPPATAQQDFSAWLSTPLGRYIVQREQSFFDRTVADLFGYYAVQVELPDYDFLRANRMPTRLIAGRGEGAQLRCDPAQLPLPTASIDLMILPHTLDFHPDPHEVLREAERVLMPEGRLVLTGFNPWSLWGITRAARRRRGMPWAGNFLTLPRVKDWLALLGLEPCSSRIHCYAPPFSRSAWVEQFEFLEFAGDRWWPVGGALYCLEAVKRVRGMRLIAPAWKKAPANVSRPQAVVGALDYQGQAADPKKKPPQV